MSRGKPAPKNQCTAVKSTYYTRTTYLQAMKRFLAEDSKADQSHQEDIEEYLLYEKQVSDRIQELLEHFVLKTARIHT